MELSAQLHAPDAFSVGEEPPLSLDKMLNIGLWVSRDVRYLLPSDVQRLIWSPWMDWEEPSISHGTVIRICGLLNTKKERTSQLQCSGLSWSVMSSSVSSVLLNKSGRRNPLGPCEVDCPAWFPPQQWELPLTFPGDRALRQCNNDPTCLSLVQERERG
jgi:hypothetical protein